MPSLVLLSLMLVAADPPEARRPPAGWVVRPLPVADGEEWRCANYAHEEWAVSAPQGSVVIAKAEQNPNPVKLPFTPTLAEGEAPNTFRGVSAVETVSDGFLAGFNRGEFGGGLYWFSSDGGKHRRISVMSSSYFPENVVAIGQEGRAFYVFQGLAHLAARRGRVLKVQNEGGRGWTGAMLADLGTAPKAIIEEASGSWLVATSDGLTRFTARGTAVQLWGQKDLGLLAPSSLVRASDGVVYIGMRGWVVRLRGLNSGPATVDVLRPAACAAFEYRKNAPCPCVPAKGDGGAP